MICSGLGSSITGSYGAISPHTPSNSSDHICLPCSVLSSAEAVKGIKPIPSKSISQSIRVWFSSTQLGVVTFVYFSYAILKNKPILCPTNLAEELPLTAAPIFFQVPLRVPV